ncbi:hypothetical protein CDAR_515861 [Caerostris darwini]|uniref:Uncharacterized protein n=1 Tax=Caerostris darwini TaxID=1538125 RepID=A0AAV4RM62_9ARAC|nr:hypothetical protein CDAR_515861 [Caerostris darwini]
MFSVFDHKRKKELNKPHPTGIWRFPWQKQKDELKWHVTITGADCHPLPSPPPHHSIKGQGGAAVFVLQPEDKGPNKSTCHFPSCAVYRAHYSRDSGNNLELLSSTINGFFLVLVTILPDSFWAPFLLNLIPDGEGHA